MRIMQGYGAGSASTALAHTLYLVPGTLSNQITTIIAAFLKKIAMKVSVGAVLYHQLPIIKST